MGRFESLGCGLFPRARDMFLDPALEVAPFQQYPAVASATFDPYVSAQSHDLPLVAAARVLLSQVNNIPNAYVHWLTIGLPTAR